LPASVRHDADYDYDNDNDNDNERGPDTAVVLQGPTHEWINC
jgi:hypothetical protein